MFHYCHEFPLYIPVQSNVIVCPDASLLSVATIAVLPHIYATPNVLAQPGAGSPITPAST